jgi:hypothetical protein
MSSTAQALKVDQTIKMNPGVKFAFDRFLTNFASGNFEMPLQLMEASLFKYKKITKTKYCEPVAIIFMGMCHKGESNAAMITAISRFKSYAKNRKEGEDSLDCDLMWAAKTLKDFFLGKGGTTKTSLKTKFIKQLLEHYDLSDEVVVMTVTNDCIDYLVKGVEAIEISARTNIFDTTKQHEFAGRAV